MSSNILIKTTEGIFFFFFNLRKRSGFSVFTQYNQLVVISASPARELSWQHGDLITRSIFFDTYIFHRRGLIASKFGVEAKVNPASTVPCAYSIPDDFLTAGWLPLPSGRPGSNTGGEEERAALPSSSSSSSSSLLSSSSSSSSPSYPGIFGQKQLKKKKKERKKERKRKKRNL